MSGYSRPEGGWRFNFEGIKTNAPADAIQPTKSPYAQNIRSLQDQTVQTRPGFDLEFTALGIITDIRAYSTLGTDNLPRYLARNNINQIYLDNETIVATLAGTALGACMITFRPNNSPQSWMYIGTQGDYKKISAPINNLVSVYDVGIKEPSSPPDVSPMSLNYYSFSAVAASWAQGGTAGAPADAARVADTATTAVADPASNNTRWSIQVATNKPYQIGQLLNIVSSGGGSFNTVIEDVIPPIAAGATLTVRSIFYYGGGSTGRCIIVPTQSPAGNDIPTFANGIPTAQSTFVGSSLASLRRGALVRLNASETCIVTAVTTGPDGTIAFEVTTAGTIAATQAITGIPTIIVSDVDATVIGQVISSVQVNSALTNAGIGTLTQALGTNPFIQALAPSTNTPQADDYVAFGINISDISKFVQGVITFDVKNAAADYVTDAYYALFTAKDFLFLAPSAPNFDVQSNPQLFVNVAPNPPAQITELVPIYDGSTGLQIGNQQITTDITPTEEEAITSLTQFPTSQWATVMIPIHSLKRLGNDQTRSLANCQGVRVSIQTTASVNISVSSFWIGGGGQPDVALNSPYFYCFVGRNKATGAKSNPSPITRYGVSPRRQTVRVVITDTVSDAQVDVWDVYRYGGTVASWRYVGSAAYGGSSTVFTDNYFDTSANGGTLLERDNFEPWPTIDVPFSATAGLSGNVTTAITVTGHSILLTYSYAFPFTNPIPSSVLSWLPGTLITIGGQSTYTLSSRPTAITLASPPNTVYYAYLFELVENAGTSSPSVLSILEPNVANQHLPFLWGPDAFGTVFGVGDPYRPGTVYSSKANNPDSAPDSYNQELCPPSEPLIGGEVINGISVVASSNRWWALYPNYGTGRNRYQPVERPVGRGLAAPFAHCTDGKRVYFCAKDGIWWHSGGPGTSLTDADLYNLFPHDGVNTPENYEYGTYTIYAPDYKYVGDFRLAFCNGFLHFMYRSTDGFARTLVCDVRNIEKPAWCMDVHVGISPTAYYALEQQEAAILTETTKYPLLLMGDSEGKIYTQSFNANDNGQPISGVCATFEYNGGDIREDQIFNDAFIDFKPVSGMSVAVWSMGVLVQGVSLFPASASRMQTSLIIGLELKCAGIIFGWTDDFDIVSTPTQLFAWQPMYQGIPVSVKQWKTQGTAFGLNGYKHLGWWNFAYRSTAVVRLEFSVYDGTAPEPVLLPSTGGALRKTLFQFTPNKGMVYFFQGFSDDGSDWAPYLSESELAVGAWDRNGPYQVVHDFDGPIGIRS